MNIQYFHRYNTLARRGLVEYLKCTCGYYYVLRVTTDDEPKLQCLACNSMVTPGIAIYDKVVEAVERFRNGSQ